MPELSDAWASSVELGHEIESWARAIAPVVRLVDEISVSVGVELKQRLVDQYVGAHPKDLAALPLPSIFRRCVVAILGHVLSEADHPQPQVAHERVRLSDQDFDEKVRQIEEFWASSLDEWAPQAASSVKLIAPVDEVKRRLVADRAATCPYRSDGDDRRIAIALTILLDEAIARLSVIGDAEAKTA
jgi:hypothetical protein